MVSDKTVSLVQQVLARTQEGKLEWEETAQEGKYQVSFPKYTITISTRGTQDPDVVDYVLGIHNQDGTLIDRVTDPELQDQVDGAYAMMSEIFNTARGQALGIEQALDELLNSLSKLAPPAQEEDEIPF